MDEYENEQVHIVDIIIIINALFFYGDHVTYKGDFERAINEAIDMEINGCGLKPRG